MAWSGTKAVLPTIMLHSLSETYVAAVLAITLFLLLALRMRAELVALLVLIALEIPGVLTRDEALSGFSNSAVITIIGLFVLSSALERTGVADRMAALLVRMGGRSEGRLIPLVMVATAGLSLVMNNIAAGAVVLPAAITVARRVNVPPAKLLMPLAFGASLGGMATIFTTANILMSNTLRQGGFATLSFLDFLPVGGLLVVAGVAYMVVVGRHLLPAFDPFAAVSRGVALQDVYNLQERLWEVQVPATSALAGQRLSEADLGERLGVTVVAVFHGQTADLNPGPETTLHGDDVLLVAGREEQVRCLSDVTIGRASHAAGYFANPKVRMAEVIVAPRATILGRSLKELEFRRRYGITTVAIWREGIAHRTHIGDLLLQAGDGLLVVGPPDRLQQLAENPSLIMVTQLPHERSAASKHRRRLALTIAGVVLILSAAQTLPTSIAVLLGFVLLVLARCLTMDEALGAIEWKTVFIIAGMLPLSTAMQKTGLADTVAHALISGIGGRGWLVLAGGLYLATMLLAQVLGGQVTALVMAPIAVSTAVATGLAPRSIGIVVAIACSSAFLTPLAHPVNLLVMGPGGYTFRDYLRVGAGLTVVSFVVVMAGTVLLLGH